MRNLIFKMKDDVVKFISSLGIGYKYLVNGFVGALVWSIYKKLRFIDALRQILVGSLVAGYITPLIAYGENIAPQYMSALSFVVGMMGMMLVDTVYKWLRDKIIVFKRMKKLISAEEEALKQAKTNK
jgi:uncharacterized membrane protein YeaQ/YmgE (transglycosylase-associated protein family)